MAREEGFCGRGGVIVDVFLALVVVDDDCVGSAEAADATWDVALDVTSTDEAPLFVEEPDLLLLLL